MNFIKNTVLCLILGLGFSILLSAQEVSNGYFLHTVMRGQSLYSIASMYNVSMEEIVSLNPGSDQKIRAGETLRIPQHKNANGTTNEMRYHTIQSGETLYRISQRYQMEADEICKANPGLSAQNFKAGQVIAIPPSKGNIDRTGNHSDENHSSANLGNTEISANKEIFSSEKKLLPYRLMHKVKRKETIYSISREYGISKEELIAANPELEKEKLKKGTFLYIPNKQETVQQLPNEKVPSNEELFKKNQKVTEQLKNINAAIILPFLLDSPNNGGEKPLMIEYYEGALMAIDSLKRQNININLHVYDTGNRNQSIASILDKDELKSMDVIFGPGHSEHINALSSFAKANNIRLVIPFTSKNTDVFNNPNIYQINTPQSYLFSQVYKLFAEQFGAYNIVFVDVEEDQGKSDYIKGLKQELETRNIHYQTISMPTVVEDEEGVSTVPGVTAALDSIRHNILIPTSGSNTALIKLLPMLQLVVRAENNPYQVHLFGYPEWQKYYEDHLQAFYELDTYFYSSFYTNNLLKAPVKFHKDFRNWYNKEMINNYPKYGMLGFDITYFFLKGLDKYGTNLEENINRITYEPVQTGFRFERVNNWGGFINKKVFFVHMTRNHELIKIDFE